MKVCWWRWFQDPSLQPHSWVARCWGCNHIWRVVSCVWLLGLSAIRGVTLDVVTTHPTAHIWQRGLYSFAITSTLNSTKNLWISIRKTFIKITNISGPRILPRGTLEVTGAHCDKAPIPLVDTGTKRAFSHSRIQLWKRFSSITSLTHTFAHTSYLSVTATF